MNTHIEIQPRNQANLYALLQGEKTLGEVRVNDKFDEAKQIELVTFAANFLSARFPISPHNAVWEVADEINRLTLVEQSNNKREWLLVLES